jgi:hypothetical protein
LTQDESLQLFSWHAFRTIHPPDDYAELSNDHVLKCAGGLPLALEVLGASLFGKDSLSNVSPTTRNQLTILVDRSLLEVNLQNQLRMNDIVRDMGR